MLMLLVTCGADIIIWGTEKDKRDRAIVIFCSTKTGFGGEEAVRSHMTIYYVHGM